jgi:hypothetical protein
MSKEFLARKGNANASANARLRLPAPDCTRPMNRIALLILATLTGAGSAYAVWLDIAATATTPLALTLRIIVAILVIGATLITWEAVFRAPAARMLRLKRTALGVLLIGVVGLGVNAFIGGRTSSPDGPVFVLSLLLILQAFLTLGHASRSE